MIFIVDIDGTICDSLDRAGKIVELESSSPELLTNEIIAEFLSEENVLKDKIIPKSEILFKLAERCNALIFFLTGRSDFAHNVTRKWLTEIFKAPIDIPLIMRPVSEKISTVTDYKERTFLKYIYPLDSTFIFFEDHEETIKRYSKYGFVLKAPECWGILK